MLRRVTAVLTAGLVLGAVAAPAALAKGPSGRGGKKPIGTVASFDGTTLTVTLKDGTTATATAGEDTQVKIDHRGRPAAKGNPTRGSLADLVAGALVLRMKTDDAALEKVRIRRAPVAAAPETEGSDDSDGLEEGDDATDEVEEGEDATEDGDDADDSDDADDDSDDLEDGIDEEVEEVEEELPLG